MIVKLDCCKRDCDREAIWLMNGDWPLCALCLPRAIEVVKELAAAGHHQVLTLLRLRKESS